MQSCGKLKRQSAAITFWRKTFAENRAVFLQTPFKSLLLVCQHIHAAGLYMTSRAHALLSSLMPSFFIDVFSRAPRTCTYYAC